MSSLSPWQPLPLFGEIYYIFMCQGRKCQSSAHCCLLLEIGIAPDEVHIRVDDADFIRGAGSRVVAGATRSQQVDAFRARDVVRVVCLEEIAWPCTATERMVASRVVGVHGAAAVAGRTCLHALNSAYGRSAGINATCRQRWTVDYLNQRDARSAGHRATSGPKHF